MRESKEVICDLLDKHKGSISKVARECGVSRQAVWSRVYMEGKGNGVWGKALRSVPAIVEMLNEGMNQKEIAKRLHLSRGSVSSAIRENIDYSYEIKNNHPLMILIDKLNSGLSIKDVSIALGYKYFSMINRINKNLKKEYRMKNGR